MVMHYADLIKMYIFWLTNCQNIQIHKIRDKILIFLLTNHFWQYIINVVRNHYALPDGRGVH